MKEKNSSLLAPLTTNATKVYDSVQLTPPAAIRRSTVRVVHVATILSVLGLLFLFQLSVVRDPFLVGKLPWKEHGTVQERTYAGYLQVRSYPDGWTRNISALEPITERNHPHAAMFFHFVPARASQVENPPLIVWLQGGPGASSNIGLFEELGPWRIDEKSGKLRKSEGAWNRRYSLLFLDSPVGTGFSYVYQGRKKKSVPIREVVEDDQPVYQEGYTMNQRAIARDLLKVLDNFYKKFPKLKKSPLYIAGESYAGKYVPHFAEEIHKYNINQQGGSSHDTIPLKGLAIGDGLTDPITQIKAHAPLALAMGFVSVEQADSMTDIAEKARDLIRQQKWIEANTVRQSLFEYFTNVTGGVNWYDIRKGSTLNNHDSLNAFLSRVDVRRALNVCVNNEAPDPCANFEDDSDIDSDHPGYYKPKAPTVYDHLQSDIMKSAKPVVQSLLDQGYKTLLYQGQFDFRDGLLGQTEWIDSMGWHGGSGYRAAHRTVWRVGQDVAGYVTEYANFRRVELLLAGHLAPGDQLVWTRHMIEDFIEREVAVSS